MVSLLPYNTLRVPAKAKEFKTLKLLKELRTLNLNEPYLFLGKGANILFVHDFAGTIIHVNLKGKKIISARDNEVTIEVAAGENWHDIVMWTVQNNWYGMENMALIPGTVGAATIGNIAAYGQNQEDIFESLTAINLLTKDTTSFSKPDCNFEYRRSVFHKPENKKYLITSVRYKLSKNLKINTSYYSRFESLIAELNGVANPQSSDIANAVIRLRRKKLPDWEKVGTAGSFFRNPVISKEKYLQLSSQVSQLQWYPTERLLYPENTDVPDFVKIPAGRLADELGWKGKTIGQVSTAPNQALCIINLGGATGQEIYGFAETMRADVKNNFDIDLEYEVVIV